MALVLLLEPDRLLARHIVNFFNLHGHRVQRFAELQAAITSTDQNRPDIVILDLAMAGRSGIEFLYELRSYSDWQSIPVVASGSLSPDERAAFAPALKQLGVTSYMSKSTVSLAELLDTVEKLLQVHEAI